MATESQNLIQQAVVQLNGTATAVDSLDDTELSARFEGVLWFSDSHGTFDHAILQGYT